MGRRCGIAALFVLSAVVPFAAGLVGAGVAAAATPRPAILSLTASSPSGRTLPAAGGRVVLSVRVRNATACTFLRASGASSPLRTVRTVACTSGRATITVTQPANTVTATLRLTFAVRARGAGGTSVQRSVRVTQAAAVPAAPTATLSISAASVPATGASISLTYSSANATSCTLSASPAFWTGANPARVNCTGTYGTTIPAGTAERTWTFTFTATNAAGRSASASQTLTQQAPPVPTAALSISASTVASIGGSVIVTYSSTNAASCSLSSSPVFVVGANPLGDCNGTYDLSVPQAYSGRTVTLTFTVTNNAGQSASANQTFTQFGQSTNWSGYIVYSSSEVVTQVSGKWTVPTLDCSSTPNAGASEWVGIGGAGSGTGVLLQTGIATDCVNGAQQNSAWWELLPAAAVYFGGFTVSTGDTIQATVSQWSDGSRWQTRVDDLTTGLSGIMVTGEGYGVMTDGSSTFPIAGSANVSYAGGYSAEWIVEAYESAGSQVDLANYGTVTFTNATTSLSSSLTADEGVELVLGGSVISTPSAPSGNGFSVSYAG